MAYSFDDYEDLNRQLAKKYGFNPQYGKNILQMESSFNPGAESGTGPLGIAQFTKDTARQYGLTVNGDVDERLQPEKAIEAMYKKLADDRAHFGGDMAKTTYAYNQGRRATEEAFSGKRPYAVEGINYVNNPLMTYWTGGLNGENVKGVSNPVSQLPGQTPDNGRFQAGSLMRQNIPQAQEQQQDNQNVVPDMSAGLQQQQLNAQLVEQERQRQLQLQQEKEAAKADYQAQKKASIANSAAGYLMGLLADRNSVETKSLPLQYIRSNYSPATERAIRTFQQF